MRRFGIMTLVTRWKSLPSGIRRSWCLFTPRAVYSHVTSGRMPMSGMNWLPLLDE